MTSYHFHGPGCGCGLPGSAPYHMHHDGCGCAYGKAPFIGPQGPAIVPGWIIGVFALYFVALLAVSLVGIWLCGFLPTWLQVPAAYAYQGMVLALLVLCIAQWRALARLPALAERGLVGAIVALFEALRAAVPRMEKAFRRAAHAKDNVAGRYRLAGDEIPQSRTEFTRPNGE